MSVSLSVIVTLHNEGALAAASLNSIRASLINQESNADVILVSDRACTQTREIAERFVEQYSEFRAIDVCNGDPSLSRNAGIQSARGEYIAVMDGDDLVPANYFHDLLTTAMASGETHLVRPELIVTFGEDHSITHQADERNVDVSDELLFEVNPWASPVLAKRSVFMSVPYPILSGSGFGYEDWSWNCDLRRHGYRNIVARGTAYFYRKKSARSSRNTSAIRGGAILPPQDLFAIGFREKQ